jgi:hypothetical protein
LLLRRRNYPSTDRDHIAARSGQQMPGYKLYFFNAEGHISHFLDLVCVDDEEAEKVAEEHPSEHLRELWDRKRKVKVFPAASTSKPR